MSFFKRSQFQARLSLGLLGGAVAIPAVVRVVANTEMEFQEIVAVEFAGSGEQLLSMAGGSAERLELLRSLLGRRDNFYVVIYSVPIALGADLLPGVARPLGLALTAGTAAADMVENLALERSLQSLLDDPDNPERADSDALLASRAAGLKFALLVPALGMAVWGITRSLRSESA